MAGAPLPIEREGVGASDFMDRMEWLDREVSKKLTDQLESEVNRAAVLGGYLPHTDLAIGCGY